VPRRTPPVSRTEGAIGTRIRALRKREALTQIALAAKLGLSQSLLSRYERGELRLHGALLAEFAKALNATSDEILGLKEVKSHGLQDQRFAKRLRRLDGLSERRKQALLMMLDSFLRDGA
jgi:transcriptional regulator with XRE-family HTH domain